ncbi:hypothetical protein [Nitrosomonas sp. ANs5]|uniref:hypothetical protein n=1 Tax=Nitrosomonas sp. ANs5 TaxID=3423941 RepID=UPI003D32EE77
MTKNQNKIFVLSLAAALVAVAWGNAQAHTRFDINTTREGTRVDNHVVIPHGCTDQPVIGNVTVFPDVSTALVDTAPLPNAAIGSDAFTRSDQPASAFVSGVITFRPILSKHVFTMHEIVNDPNGNPIAEWQAGGSSIPASNWVAKLPVRVNPINIEPTSCVNRLIVAPAIANICQLTSIHEINGKDSDRLDVDFWTAPEAGHPQFDGPAWNFPAPYIVTRNLETNPLPENCGEGITARIYPSAQQLDRDMPVRINGTQVWPLP